MMNNAELVAAWDEDENRLDKCVRDYDIPQSSVNIDEILSLPIDAVIVCSRNTTHAYIACKSAKAGKHVLCEKPIATTIEDGERIIKACKDAKVKLMTAFPCRFLPQMKRAKYIFQEGKLGALYAIRATNHGSMPGGWFIDPELSGGGAVLDHTVHVIDLLRWITGLEVTTVYAEMDTRLHNIPCEDIGMLTFTLGDSTFGTLDTSWSRSAAFPIWGDVTLRFVGSNGILEVDGFPRAFHIYDLNHTPQHYALSGGDNADLEMIKEFIAAIQEDRESLVSGEDGLEALRVALSAYQSTQEIKSIKNK
jgi:predicted dehydrogenase